MSDSKKTVSAPSGKKEGGVKPPKEKAAKVKNEESKQGKSSKRSKGGK
jgi:hypothetical protein